MDCCNFIASVDTCLALLVGATCVIVYSYFADLFQIRQKYNRKKDISLTEQADIKGIVCQSVNCVRCSYNVLFQQNARNRFITYFEKHRNKQLCRLENAALLNDKTSGNEQNRYILYLPGLSSSVWFDPKLTHRQDIEKLENNYSEILEEFYKINHKDGWIINENKKGCWRVFHLVCQGKMIEANASRCPKTMNIVKDMDQVMSETVFGYVTFSVMEPGTVINPHYGSTNCRIRCHLGLKVGPDTCYIEAAGQQKSWEEGKCLIFDDSFLHSAYHNGTDINSFRAVLMIDMWHPGLNKIEIDCVSTVYTSNLTPQSTILH